MMCDIRKQSLASVIGNVLKSLDAANPDGVAHGRPLDIIQMRYALANLYAYEGEMDKSIEQWQTAYEIAQAQLPGAMPELEEVLGIASLHKSEMDNDIYRHPGDQCIFPPHANRSFAKPASSEKAIEYLLKYLQRKPDALDVRWILNLAYMTLGKYPAGGPPQYLTPPTGFDSAEDVGRFVDVAPAAGINLYSMSGGLIVDDFERNGLFDIVTSDFGQCAPMHYFHNNGDGTFADRTTQAGLADQLGGLNLIQTDYNNDGCLDIFVLRGAWEFPQRSSLLRNNCDGTFTDVTAASGLNLPMQTQTGVWADIDNDGYLDLFIGNENGPSHLYRNKGDGTFEDISHAAGIDRASFDRLRRGQLPIEARLDLHGLTQAEAHRELTRFITTSDASGKRLVLVITGKGRPGSEGMGVLRQAVPRWLNEPGLRGRILALTPAQPRDGGAGALYVLLRRKRES